MTPPPPRRDSGPNYVTLCPAECAGQLHGGHAVLTAAWPVSPWAWRAWWPFWCCTCGAAAAMPAPRAFWRRYKRRKTGSSPPPLRRKALPPAPAPPPQPAPGALVPEEASLYTEEFSLPPQQAEGLRGDSYQAYPEEGYVYEDQAYQEEDYGESYGQYREDYPQDVYYEDDGDALLRHRRVRVSPPSRPRRPPRRPRPQDQAPASSTPRKSCGRPCATPAREYQDLDD